MASSFRCSTWGSLAREAGHPGLAQNLLEQARAVAREMGECLNECHVALQIGGVHLALGQVAEAEAELKAARDIARKFGARRLCAEADRGLAEICLVREDHMGAREHASRAAAEGEEIGSRAAGGRSPAGVGHRSLSWSAWRVRTRRSARGF